jgi:hypothetical protein
VVYPSSSNPQSLPLTTDKFQTPDADDYKHDVDQFLYSKFLVVLWSNHPPPPKFTHLLLILPPANYKHMNEVLFILVSFSIPSGLHSNAAVKTLMMWQCHDYVNARWQFLGKNKLCMVSNDKSQLESIRECCADQW